MGPLSIGYNSINPYPGGYTAGHASVTFPDRNPSVGKSENASPQGVQKTPGVEGECQTCKNRKYQDGSDEMVSFKAPTHISPQAAAVSVRAHEQEHVSNAYKKAALEDAEVVRASVTIHTDICPECGRSYVSGGTTETQIKYTNEKSPYQQAKKAADAYKYKGMHINLAL